MMEGGGGGSCSHAVDCAPLSAVQSEPRTHVLELELDEENLALA